MRHRPVALFPTLLLILVLVLAGCGPRATGGQTAALAGADRAVVDLPALMIDIGTDGKASIGGAPLAELAALANVDSATLDQLSIDEETLNMLVDGNIQHIQLDNATDGIIVLINGEPIPTVVWNDESLVTTAEMLDAFGVGVSLLDKLLPLIRTIGLGFIVRLPVAEGNEPIPTVVVGDASAAAAAQAAQDEFLASVGRAPKVQVVVNYAEDGTWSIGGLSQEEWSEVAPIPWEALTLDAGFIASAKEAGISTIGLATNRDGIFMSVNGDALPYISWANGEIFHVLKLAGQLGLLDQAMGDNPDIEQLLDTIEKLLPAVQASNINLVINFQ
ncbi:hypothetical protein KFU94_51915 [Chloroflexi bacterium TSY]|nr:hypothetical protein [Chloroflexi bacterium TSY]